VRAIRHGITPSGRSVLIMPSLFFDQISQDDLGAMIAYLKSVPPVDNVLPETEPGLLFYALIGLGPLTEGMSALHIDHQASFSPSPAESQSSDYGAYLVEIAQCRACHGYELAGGRVCNSCPIGPNLTPGGGLGSWTNEDFLTALRTGESPSGRQIDDYMPWEYFRHMSDTEINAVWAYLGSQPALETQIP
jgi:cytochrome c553